VCVLILDVVHGLLTVDTAVVSAEFDLVERFGRGEPLSVRRAHLVSVCVGLWGPA